MQEPRVVLLIGPSASGKSTFGSLWLRLYPRYKTVDDLPLVLEYRKTHNVLEIKDPAVWDDIIVQLGRSLSLDNKYIVEFARGHEPNYLKHFGISKKDVYPRTLKLFFNSLEPCLASQAAVIHVTSSYKTRCRRNNERRTTTGQNLPDKVLEEVFKEEIFSADYNGSLEENIRYGKIHIEKRQISVVTIDNESLSPLNISELLQKAMRYFTEK